MSLVGKKAPAFTATAVMGDNTINSNFSLSHYAKDKMCVLFFYPLDFTFVCPTEILRFNDLLAEFEKRDAVVVGVSIDSQFSHLAYKNTQTEQGGIGNVKFPLVSDITKNIARDYGILCNDSIAYRATFIISQTGEVVHETVNTLPLGRNIEEYLRLVDAWHFHQKHGEVCPANWQPGAAAMKPTQEGVAKYLSNRKTA